MVVPLVDVLARARRERAALVVDAAPDVGDDLQLVGLPVGDEREQRRDVVHELGELGTSWRVPEYSFKPYPCCRCNHTLIGIGIELYGRGIRADAVESAEIRLGHTNWLTVGEPYDARRDSVVHAQFNAAYSFARALADGAVGLASYQKPAITDSAVTALAARTAIVSDSAIEPIAIEPARVVVTLKDGQKMNVARETIKGSPQEPMNEEELLAKFRNCLDFGLGATRSQADRLADTVLKLESATDVGAALVGAFPDP